MVEYYIKWFADLEKYDAIKIIFDKGLVKDVKSTVEDVEEWLKMSRRNKNKVETLKRVKEILKY